MARRLQLRRGSSAEWAAANPILALGEPGYDTTLGRLKIGTGAASWSDLPFLDEGAAMEETDPVASPALAAAVADLNAALNLKQDVSTAATDAELAAHTGATNNPHAVTKTQVGLGSVNNTADSAKPVSTAQQAALDLKAPLAATQSAAKTADQSVTSTTALVDVTELDLTIGASATEVWLAEWTLVLVAASATPDIKLGLSGPAAWTSYWGVIGYANGWEAAGIAGSLTVLQTQAAVSQPFGLGTAIGGLVLRAVVKSGGTAGTVKLRFAQNTSDAGATTVKALSTMTAWKVAG